MIFIFAYADAYFSLKMFYGEVNTFYCNLIKAKVVLLSLVYLGLIIFYI